MFAALPISCNARFVRQIDAATQRLVFICAGTDGSLLKVDQDGVMAWRTTTHCYPHDIWVGDLNNDGVDEILIAASDGALYGFSGDGKILFTLSTWGPLFQVCVADMGLKKRRMILTGGADHVLYVLDAQGRLQREISLPKSSVPGPLPEDSPRHGQGAAKFIRAGRLERSGEMTLIVSENLRVMHNDLLFFQGEDLRQVDAIPRFERNYRGHDMRNMSVFDIDGDGVDELVFGQGTWKGDGFWVYKKPTADLQFVSLHDANSMYRGDTMYRDTWVVPLPVNGAQRTVALCGHHLSLLDEQNRKIQHGYATCPFMSVSAYMVGTAHGVVLASGFGGDENIYRLEFNGNWVEQLEGFRRTGTMATFSRNVAELTEKIHEVQDDDATSNVLNAHAEAHIVQVGACYIYRHTVHEIPHYLAHHNWVARQFPYANLTFATFVAISETQERSRGHASLLGHRFDPDEVVQILGLFEQRRVPFMLYYSQGYSVSIGVNTLERIIKACPNTFLGCYTAECESSDSDIPAAHQRLIDFIDSSLIPVLELLKKNGKKHLLNEKNSFYFATAFLPRVYARLFSGAYSDVLIPCVEDSSSRSPELNLAGRVGLWLSGAVSRWGTRSTTDDFGNSHVWHGGHPVMSGHQTLRKMVAHASLGATVFQFNCGQDNGSGEPGYSPTQGDVFFWTRVGLESTVPFLHLVGKKILPVPNRCSLAGVNKVSIAISPCNRFSFTANNQSHCEEFIVDEREDDFIFSRLSSEWIMGPTHANHLSALIFKQKMQGNNFVPQTPYGFITLVPIQAVRDGKVLIVCDEKQSRQFLETPFSSDGETGHENGKAIPADAWRKKLLDHLERFKSHLPCVAQGSVFASMTAMKNGYIVCIVDSELERLHAKDSVVRFNGQIPRQVIDVLSGEELMTREGTVALRIAAGMFRLLRVRY